METFILIPGRTSRQGTSLNEGKLKKDYVEETSTLFMNPDDMARLGLKNGDQVRLRPAKVQFRHLTRGPGSFFEILRDKFGWAVTPRQCVRDLRGGSAAAGS